MRKLKSDSDDGGGERTTEGAGRCLLLAAFDDDDYFLSVVSDDGHGRTRRAQMREREMKQVGWLCSSSLALQSQASCFPRQARVVSG